MALRDNNEEGNDSQSPISFEDPEDISRYSISTFFLMTLYNFLGRSVHN